MTTKRKYSVAAFNVRGLQTAIEEVEVFRRTQKTQILSLTETWMNPEKSFPRDWRTVSASIHQPKPGRGRGVVALVLAGDPIFKNVYKLTTELIQMVAIRIGDLVIGTIYVSPCANPTQMTTELNNFTNKCRGRFFPNRVL